jgi:serine/threonine protein kinase
MADGRGLEDVANEICAKRAWTLVGAIGGGAFKQSFRAKAADGAEFALKILTRGTLDRLDREIEAMQRCKHPGIGGLVAVERMRIPAGEILYFIEQFQPGGTLTDELKNGAMTVPRVREIGKALSEALQYLDSLGLVHRDLKPDNIVLNAAGSPVIIDFGVVRDLGDESLTKTHLARGPGTPLFAPPEQLNNRKQLIDWRSDQFSLGVTLSYCAFGMHPYAEPGDPDNAVVDRVAAYLGPSAAWADKARAAGLEPLIQMVKPYPVHRVCSPAKLVANWS